MKSDPKVIDFLNAELKNELTAINQYFLHARMLGHWGFERMAKHEYDESIGEMKHADKLIERILMLGGLPNLQDLHKLLLGETTPEMLGCDLQLEQVSQATLKDAIAPIVKIPSNAIARFMRRSLGCGHNAEARHLPNATWALVIRDLVAQRKRSPAA